MQETEKYGGRLQTVNVNSDSIKAIVQRTAQEAAISNRAERVELQDMQAVRQIAADYLNECAQSGFLPTVSGIASRLGRTRQALYFYASTHRGEPFDEWLTFFSDQCGETMIQAALAGAVRETVAIFTAKARFGWRDNINIEVSTPEKTGEQRTAESLSADYADFIE